MRKEALGRGLSLPKLIQLMQKLNADFGAGYEKEDSAPDVVFVVFTIHAFTGVREIVKNNQYYVFPHKPRLFNLKLQLSTN
jgi:hypothetical protein